MIEEKRMCLVFRFRFRTFVNRSVIAPFAYVGSVRPVLSDFVKSCGIEAARTLTFNIFI